MSDEEYLQLLQEGKDPAKEHFYRKLLVSLGAGPKKADRIARLLTSPVALRLSKISES